MSIVEWFFLKFSKAPQVWAPSSCRKWFYYLLFFLPLTITAFCPSLPGLFICLAALALSILSCTTRSYSRHWGHHMLEAQQCYLTGEMSPFHKRQAHGWRLKMTLLHQQPPRDWATATRACSWRTTAWEFTHLLRSWLWFPCLIWQAATG